jgi:hypothetical protein
MTRPNCHKSKSKNQLAHTFCEAIVSLERSVRCHMMARSLNLVLSTRSSFKANKSSLKDTRGSHVCSTSKAIVHEAMNADIYTILRFRRMKRILWLLLRRWCRSKQRLRLRSLRVKLRRSKITRNNLIVKRQYWISCIPRLLLVKLRISKHLSSHYLQIHQSQWTLCNGLLLL